MTDGERLFVSIIQNNDLGALSKIHLDWLEGNEVAEMNFLLDYYKNEGRLLGLHAFCSKFRLDPTDVDADPSYYLKLLYDRYVYVQMSERIPPLMHTLKKSPLETLGSLKEMVSELSVTSSQGDILYSDNTDERKQMYEDKIGKHGVTYLSMGYSDMDELFYGYKPADLITFGGKAGIGKTWLITCLVSKLANTIKSMGDSSFGDILFISNEMSETEIQERLDCIQFSLPYKTFLAGELPRDLRIRYYRGLDELKKSPSRIRILYNCQTIEDLSTYLGIYRPSAVFVDGSYLMDSGKNAPLWERVTYITRNLKRLAKTFGVPIINTTQLRRGASKSSSKYALDGQEDFAYTNAYSQDSDIAIRMYQNADMLFHDVIGLEVVKGRRVVSGTKLIFKNDLLNMVQEIKKNSDSLEETYDF